MMLTSAAPLMVAGSSTSTGALHNIEFIVGTGLSACSDENDGCLFVQYAYDNRRMMFTILITSAAEALRVRALSTPYGHRLCRQPQH